MSLWSVAALAQMSVPDPEALFRPGAWAVSYTRARLPTRKAGPVRLLLEVG